MTACNVIVVGGVAVLDTKLRGEVWNDKACNLCGVHPDEVRGMHFMTLDTGSGCDGVGGRRGVGNQPASLLRNGKPTGIRAR